MEAIQAVLEYESFSSRVYSYKTKSTNKAKYSTEIFEKSFKEIVGRAGFNPDDPFEEENVNCKT